MHAYHLINFRVTLLLMLLFVLLSARSFSQSGAGAAGSKMAAESDILSIRKAWQQINSNKLSKQRFTYESPGCVEAGEVIYFFDKNKEIVKITESGFIGDGSWVYEYYYSAGKLIFCLETMVGGPADAKPTKTQYRFYIKNDRTLREMKENKIITPDIKATEILQISKKIQQAYKTKDFISVTCN